jgi:hypothetical protein
MNRGPPSRSTPGGGHFVFSSGQCKLEKFQTFRLNLPTLPQNRG